MKDNQNLQPELEKLAASLKNLDKPILSEKSKLFMKSRIMEKTNAPVAEYLNEASNGFSLSLVKKAAIKERLMELIEGRSQRGFFWENLFTFHKKAVSMALVFVMMLSFVSYLNLDVNVVSASTITTFDQLEGDVVVERDGDLIKAKVGMELYEQDKIMTGDDSFATIHFFDDSVSRLAAETRIVINKLFRPEDSAVKSYVEVSVDQGVVWSRVLNLVEDHSSFVIEAVDVYLSAQRAAFNVEVESGELDVDVYNHALEVRGVDDTSQLLTGQSASLRGDGGFVVGNISDGEQSADWIAANLHHDQEYILEVEKKLLLAKAERSGQEIAEEFSLKDSAILILTFDDVKQMKLELELAEEDFMIAAATLNQRFLQKDERDNALAAIDRFEAKVVEFYDFIEEVGFTDEGYADELRRYVADKVLAQKKNFSLVRSNSPLYLAKEVIADLELLDASGDEVKIVKVKRDQALDKLSEAEEAKSRGDEELAQKAIEEYKDELEEVEVIVDALEGDDVTDVKRDFASKLKNDKALLNQIEGGGKLNKPAPVEAPKPEVKVEVEVPVVEVEAPLPPEFIVD